MVGEGDYKTTCFCKLFVQAVHDGGLDPKFPFVTDEGCFHLCRYIGAQKSKHWSSINLRETLEVPIHNQNIAMWCAVSATQIAGPTVFF